MRFVSLLALLLALLTMRSLRTVTCDPLFSHLSALMLRPSRNLEHARLAAGVDERTSAPTKLNATGASPERRPTIGSSAANTAADNVTATNMLTSEASAPVPLHVFLPAFSASLIEVLESASDGISESTERVEALLERTTHAPSESASLREVLVGHDEVEVSIDAAAEAYALYMMRETAVRTRSSRRLKLDAWKGREGGWVGVGKEREEGRRTGAVEERFQPIHVFQAADGSLVEEQANTDDEVIGLQTSHDGKANAELLESHLYDLYWNERAVRTRTGAAARAASAAAASASGLGAGRSRKTHWDANTSTESQPLHVPLHVFRAANGSLVENEEPIIELHKKIDLSAWSDLVQLHAGCLREASVRVRFAPNSGSRPRGSRPSAENLRRRLRLVSPGETEVTWVVESGKG